MEKIVQILEAINPGVDYENEKALIDDGLIDSFSIISIVLELNEAYGINISVGDLEPENFNSVAAIKSLVKELQKG